MINCNLINKLTIDNHAVTSDIVGSKSTQISACSVESA